MKKLFLLLLSSWLLLNQELLAQPGCNLDVEATPPTAVLSCQNPSVQIQTSVTPMPTSFWVSWAGPSNLPSILDPVITSPGVYAVFVFDSLNNCWGGDTIVVTQDGSLPTVSIAVETGCTTGNDPVTLTAAATGTGPFTYNWSTGATGPEIDVTGAGQYCVTATDQALGCSATSCFFLQTAAPLDVSVYYYPGNFFCGDSSVLCFSASGGIPPYSYTWSPPQNWLGPCVFDPSPGTYIMTVTDAVGCSQVVSQVVEEEIGECAHLEGTVFADWNTNCAFDATDEGFAGVIIRIVDGSGSERFAHTGSGGNYSLELYPGTYTVSALAPNGLWVPCQGPAVVTLAPSQTVDHDFLLKPLANCPAMTVDISSHWLRRCFSGQYWINYCNKGTAPATNAYIDLQLDPFLNLTSAQLPFTNLGNNTYRFDLGTVPFNSCDDFWVGVYVSCDAVLGQTHCTEATIFPPGDCLPDDPQWSKASLELSAVCETDSIDFQIKNTGTGAMLTPLEYVVIEDAVMLMQAPPPAILLGIGGVHHVKVPANGSTWRVEVEQVPFHPGLSQPSLSMEGCGSTPAGNFSTGFVTQFPADDDDPWIDIDCSANVGSYDPNDKQASPEGYGATHFIDQNTDIEYTIRFQNTGTDTAFTVVIRDELSPWLDPATVRPGASSHPFTFDFYDDRNIKFTFDDINLPDSSRNFEGSQGFVSFRISQEPNVPLQTNILNSAAIFFDFNAPVVTNTVQHRVGKNFVTVSAWQPFLAGLDLRVAPNPVGESAVFQLEGLRPGTEWQIVLSDAAGRPLRHATVQGSRWTFERDDLPSGVYFLRVLAAGQVQGTGKVMLK